MDSFPFVHFLIWSCSTLATRSPAPLFSDSIETLEASHIGCRSGSYCVRAHSKLLAHSRSGRCGGPSRLPSQYAAQPYEETWAEPTHPSHLGLTGMSPIVTIHHSREGWRTLTTVRSQRPSRRPLPKIVDPLESQTTSRSVLTPLGGKKKWHQICV